ncbi:MAG: hypothetical protein IJD13_03805 [Oscillospiraceae bacterium]|nr:hypothetical protein [Oscillospiraceae bacterium]
MTRIEKQRVEVEGDQSPDTETKVYRILSFVCRNPRCEHHGEEVGETKVQIN